MINRSYFFGIIITCIALEMQAATPRKPDWLLSNGTYKSHVVVSDDRRELTLENGLVRRVIRLAPNATTISYENLMVGESLIRAVRPEALIELDGRKYEVGGLGGQPIQNFLKPDWIPQLQANPDAFQFKEYRVGKTVERFAWKKRMEWMPKDVPWPAPGVSITLTYEAPKNFGGVELPRDVVFSEDFKSLAPEWKVFLSKRSPRTSFQNEGKVGEILAYENTHAFAEHAWPEGGEVVECVVDPGTDKSATWGPGIGLVFGDGSVTRFYLRSGKKQFGINGRGQIRDTGDLEEGRPYVLRMTLTGGKVRCDASVDGKNWERIAEPQSGGKPVLFRVGKQSTGNGIVDYQDNGQLERCFIRSVKILGPAKESLEVKKQSPAAGKVMVDVHYEIFDGIPLISKWITVRNESGSSVRLNTFVSENLAMTEAESVVGNSPAWRLPAMLVETDYSFGGSMGTMDTTPSVHWMKDPTYTSQVSYDLNTPCVLQCRPPLGPDQVIAHGGEFESFRTFELACDSTDRERNGLAKRRMYRCIAPWVTENPILMHVRSAQPAAVKLAIDQCAEVGFEMVILTFGSGFNFESRSQEYQARIKELVDYGRKKGVVLGGYSLCASRGAGTPADNTVGKATFGVSPCLSAQWGRQYLDQLKSMMQNTGLAVLEHDGSYPGDTCSSTNHPYHQGQLDSQWTQWKAITDLYKWCRGNGVYLNIPDWYFLTGGTKTGMGYREVNWSLPREYQEIIERQNIFDGTWEKTPSMGWMFVPLTEYQGGGAAATIEPLKDHLPHYEQRLANLFGAGVMACYRGPRLYDTEETKLVVKKWVDFYKKHREVLNGDLVHLRRADGRDLDYILHVNPAGKEKGLLMVYNPLQTPVKKTLRIPLYYTGKSSNVSVSEKDAVARKFTLDRGYQIELPVNLSPSGVSWFVIQ